jgi:hypothetical protein
MQRFSPTANELSKDLEMAFNLQVAIANLEIQRKKTKEDTPVSINTPE